MNSLLFQLICVYRKQCLNMAVPGIQLLLSGRVRTEEWQNAAATLECQYVYDLSADTCGCTAA